MKADEVQYLWAHSADFEGVDSGNAGNIVLFNLNTLPLDYYPASSSPGSANPNQGALDHQAPAFFNLWHRLNSIYTLKASLPAGNTGLFDIFQAAAAGASTTTIGPIIVQATGWSATDVAALINLPPANYANEIMLVQFAACMGLVVRLGVSAAQLLAWAGNGSSPGAAEAQDIQNTIKARYNDDTWPQVGKPLNDKVRESSKEALIAYILTMPTITVLGITDADGLYEYFLIDVQMSPCMLTSRIVQASAAVQLFVERCLMNLENGNSNLSLNVAPSQIDGQEWETCASTTGSGRPTARSFCTRKTISIPRSETT